MITNQRYKRLMSEYEKTGSAMKAEVDRHTAQINDSRQNAFSRSPRDRWGAFAPRTTPNPAAGQSLAQSLHK
jgi:hypothetical protein